MSACYLGIDTSCYTTSVACYSAEGVIYDSRKLLQVEQGHRGLRQSEGLYQHIKQLPELMEALFNNVPSESIQGIGCSFTPTAAEGSYMPVFLAGSGLSRSLSAALQVPLFRLNHQAGHIRAALVGNEGLLKKDVFYALHMSGGTTDLLLVRRTETLDYDITLLGQSQDIHAGQLVDRIGVRLGCSFPAGQFLEVLARKAEKKDIKVPSHVVDCNCSLSGAENFLESRMNNDNAPEIAYAVYDLLSRTLTKMINNASVRFGSFPVLLCGGVSSSLLIRELLYTRNTANLHFGATHLSSDNAVGVAAIAFDKAEAGILC